MNCLFFFFDYHLVFVSHFVYSPGIQLKKIQRQFLYPVVSFSGPPGYITVAFNPQHNIPNFNSTLCPVETLVLILSEPSEIVILSKISNLSEVIVYQIKQSW